jgi:type II secretory ATPase GspE/PulE/Tfp pilus assembly ATPase PilB-like protein
MQDEDFISHLWQEILQAACTRQASDIHIEPGELLTLIRLRIDGVLFVCRQLKCSWHNQFISHIKILANLDIGEKRLPQDGRYRHLNVISNQFIDCRISTIPTIHGEKIVVRLLNQFNPKTTLYDLGLSPWQLNRFLNALESPQGLILITGPTGSGKSTSLYTALQHLNDGRKNISTVEDPCEMEIPGINQVMVNTKSGLDFPLALRALLRQDPDVIMIGEIRDALTAQIALQASQTGHLVLASLHTNNSFSTIQRMEQLGCEINVLSECLQLISAQRLVRVICRDCVDQLSETMSNSCRSCSGSGYFGRIAVHEVMPFNAAIRHKISQGAPIEDLVADTKELGMNSLRENAELLILNGTTNASEVRLRIGSAS